jgi:hypothetical protein
MIINNQITAPIKNRSYNEKGNRLEKEESSVATPG